jgi:uncharacterized protein YggE
MVELGRTRTTWFLVVAAVAVTIAVLVPVAGLGSGHDGRAVAATVPAADDTVSVSGVGTVQGVPDTLRASFGVHVTRSSVQSALDAEGGAVRRVLAALKQQGLVGRDVQTTNLSLSQHYDNRGNVSGYDAVETVSAKISPLGSAGKAIAAAATASGNDVSIDGLTFDIADDHALLGDARAKSYADARDRATQYAALAHRSLGDVMKVTETVTSEQPVPRPYYDGVLSAGSAGKSAAIRAGEQPVTVTVTVVWRLK